MNTCFWYSQNGHCFQDIGVQGILQELEGEQIEVEEEEQEDDDNDDDDGIDIENEIMDNGDLEMLLHGKKMLR